MEQEYQPKYFFTSFLLISSLVITLPLIYLVMIGYMYIANPIMLFLIIIAVIISSLIWYRNFLKAQSFYNQSLSYILSVISIGLLNCIMLYASYVAALININSLLSSLFLLILATNGLAILMIAIIALQLSELEKQNISVLVILSTITILLLAVVLPFISIDKIFIKAVVLCVIVCYYMLYTFKHKLLCQGISTQEERFKLVINALIVSLFTPINIIPFYIKQINGLVIKNRSGKPKGGV